VELVEQLKAPGWTRVGLGIYEKAAVTDLATRVDALSKLVLHPAHPIARHVPSLM
jgi:hypothetical protein